MSTERFHGANHLCNKDEHTVRSYEPAGQRLVSGAPWWVVKLWNALSARWGEQAYREVVATTWIDPSEEELVHRICSSIDISLSNYEPSQLYLVVGHDVYPELHRATAWRTGPMARAHPSDERFRSSQTVYGLDTYYYPWLTGYAVLPYPVKPRK